MSARFETITEYLRAESSYKFPIKRENVSCNKLGSVDIVTRGTLARETEGHNETETSSKMSRGSNHRSVKLNNENGVRHREEFGLAEKEIRVTAPWKRSELTRMRAMRVVRASLSCP